MIYRESHQTNFSVRSNALLQDTTLSDPAYRLLNHLLSLPPDWNVYPKQLMKYFSWSKDRVYKALKELRARGYATLKRCRRSSTWTIYETPLMGQTDATPCAEIVDEPNDNAASKIPSIKNSCLTDALQNNKISLTKKKNTTTAPEFIAEQIESQNEIVVVSSEEVNPPVFNHAIQQTALAPLPIEIPEPTPEVLSECGNVIPDAGVSPVIINEVAKLPLAPKEKKIAAKTLSNLTLDECKMILAVYAAALTKGGVNNKIGYLVALKKSAVNGNLSPVVTNGVLPLAERLARQEADRKAEAERGRITNEQWVKMMAARGIKVQI